jgi:hypothetical protein
MTLNRSTFVLAGALVMALAGSGCLRGIASGGGTIPSKYPDTRGATKANFGFWGDSCGDGTTGNFNYHDKSVYNENKGGGLKMVGPVELACDCTEIAGDTAACDTSATGLCGIWNIVAEFLGWVGADGHVTAIQAHYYSSNPKIVGGGKVVACVVDNGEGSKADADDQAAVKVLDGPYAGYINGGEVSGNIQSYPCPDED